MASTIKGFFLVGAFVASAAILGGCEQEQFFRKCPLTPSIIAACEDNSENTDLICAVTGHPLCNEAVCARYEGSEGFCTRLCTVDEECPVASTCEYYLDDVSFCVPDEVLAPGDGTVAP